MIWCGIEVLQCFADNDYTYKYNYIKKNGSSINTLLLGNSYFHWGLDPLAINDSCFNAATSARWIYYDRMILQNLIIHTPNLKNVIYPIGHKIPFCGIEHNENPKHNRAPMIRYEHAKFMNIFYHPTKNHKYPYLDWYGGDVISYWTLKSKHKCMDSGFAPQDFNGVEVHAEKLMSDTLINSLTAQSNVKEFFDELKLIAEICEQHNIRLITVIPPVTRHQYEMIQPQITEIIINNIAEIQKNNRFEFYDFSNLPEFSDNALFCDHTHLNASGAKLFGKIINNKILSSKQTQWLNINK